MHACICATSYVAAGIYVGDGKVIHLASEKHCGYHREIITLDGLVESCLDCFLDGSTGCLFLFDYGVSALHFLLNSSGTCSTTSACDHADSTRREASVDRARSAYYSSRDQYDHLNDNCETFATYCRTGRQNVSLQSLSMRSIEDKFSVFMHVVYLLITSHFLPRELLSLCLIF